MSCKCGWIFESPITLLLTGVPSFQKILLRTMHLNKLLRPSDLYVDVVHVLSRQCAHAPSNQQLIVILLPLAVAS